MRQNCLNDRNLFKVEERLNQKKKRDKQGKESKLCTRVIYSSIYNNFQNFVTENFNNPISIIMCITDLLCVQLFYIIFLRAITL